LRGSKNIPTKRFLARLVGRRVAGAHPLVDLEERLALRLDRVLPEGGDEGLADRLPLGEEDLDRDRLLLRHDRRRVGRDLGAGLVEDLAGVEVDDVDGEEDPALSSFAGSRRRR
jgi:hypothetical protein